MTQRLNDIEQDILGMLSHGAETAQLLAEDLSEEDVRGALESLAARGLVRSAEGIDPYDPTPGARATWWLLTEKGRSQLQ